MDLLDTQVHGLIGDDGFVRLCSAFFRRVPADDILGPMYQHDLAGAERRLRGFLIGRFAVPIRTCGNEGIRDCGFGMRLSPSIRPLATDGLR